MVQLAWRSQAGRRPNGPALRSGGPKGQTQRAQPAQGRANSEPRSLAAAAPLNRAAAGPKKKDHPVVEWSR
ncbi:hypothetical protein SGRA_1682 [Saprospira grandis str. Lewin]|uniref:Uncharacterized protein n=1 Tax=Saprospira grandis (strain Lewin) TaxID=984262 RepID=H6LAD2_SAPGL|nr:hypothetical protein SGRA_1682 [Saprospira grandis str. Lewin]